MILAAESVGVRYRGLARPALEGVSISLHPGELVAVAGPNGSGKTTLVRALLGLAHPTTGRVMLDGRTIESWSRRAIAQVVGALPQREEPAFPMRVRDAILLGRWAHLGPIAPAGHVDDAAIAAAVERCDVGDLVDRNIDTLSGGEWQRVRLARTLAAMPRILLLDEPTAALDIGHEMALFELLTALARDGLGVLVITHHLNVAARYADRIVLMHSGRLVADGTPRDVIESERLTTLFEWPIVVSDGQAGAPQFTALCRDERDPRRAG